MVITTKLFGEVEVDDTKKITFVHPYEESEATLYLLQARKGGKLPGTVITPPLIIRDANREYTPALRKIYFED